MRLMSFSRPSVSLCLMVAISSDSPSHHNRLPPITDDDQQQRLEISIEAADQRAEAADHAPPCREWRRDW